MNTVYLLVRLNEDDSIAQILSAHPNNQTAVSAERFYRSYEGKKIDRLRTDVIPVDFEA